MQERLTETPKETFVLVTLNRASLGEAEYVFAKINSAPGSPTHTAYIPRKDITVDKQPLTGSKISARLKVRIVEGNKNGFLIETEDQGRPVRWKVDREGKILPAKLEPVFNV
jgi:hypothetical protein